MVTDRRVLAGDLRACVPSGEPVLWHSTAAAVKIWQSAATFTAAVLALSLIPALWLNLFGAFDWPHRGLWISGLLMGLAIPTCFASFRICHTATVLTQTHLHVRSPIPGRKVRSIARSDITGATIFDSDNVVFVETRNGDRIRLGAVRKSRELAFALNVPARIWAAHAGPRSGRVLSFILFGLAVGLPQAVIYDFAAYKELRWSALPVIALAAVAAFLLGHGYRAWRMEADERRRTACKLLDPRWRGCEPYPSGRIPIWRIPIATMELWLVRVFYGMPPDCAVGHAPEIIEPDPHAAE